MKVQYSKAVLIILACSLSAVYTGCKKDDDPAPIPTPTPAPVINAMSDLQINWTMDGASHSWVENNQTPYFLLSTVNITGTTTSTAGYTMDFKDMTSTSAWIFRMLNHVYTPPCDSAKFLAFVPKDTIPFSAFGTNGISMQFNDANNDVWRPVLTDSTNVFRIEDTYYYQSGGDQFVRFYATFSCKVSPPAMSTPVKTVTGSAVLELKNDQ